MTRLLSSPPEDWNNRRLLKIVGPSDGSWHVPQGEVAISSYELKTRGLYTCAALAVAYGGVNLLAHVDASTNAYLLKDSILGAYKNLDLDEHPTWQVEVLNGNLISVYAHNVIKKALELAEITDRVVERRDCVVLTLFDTVRVCGDISVERGLPHCQFGHIVVE